MLRPSAKRTVCLTGFLGHGRQGGCRWAPRKSAWNDPNSRRLPYTNSNAFCSFWIADGCQLIAYSEGFYTFPQYLLHAGWKEGRVQAPDAATVPYFFLSYSHKSCGDTRDEGELDYWVDEFFRDLCRSVRHYADLPEGVTPGFMDTDRRVGDDWPVGAVRALKNCRTFVPLYSDRYFGDECCGKEWKFFTSRMPEPAAAEAAIVPAIWDPVELRNLPPAARAPQFRYGGNEPYESLGLYQIMKVSRYRARYEEAVSELARSIVAVAERHPIKWASAGEPCSLESAFSPTGAYSRVSERVRVRMTVVAPQRDELPAERRNSSSYGPSALDWRPYGGDPARPVAQEAAAVARSLRYTVEVGDLYQHEARLLAGDQRYGPQILIVDPWALLVARTQQILQHINDAHLPWVQTVIAWDTADDDNQEHEGKLRAVLESTFPRKLAEIAPVSSMAAQGVPSMDDFAEVLGLVIGAAARKYLGSVAAYPPGKKTVERPRLMELGRLDGSVSFCRDAVSLPRQPAKHVPRRLKRAEMSAIRGKLAQRARDAFGQPFCVGDWREHVSSAMPEIDRHVDLGHIEPPGGAERQDVINPALGGNAQPFVKILLERRSDLSVGYDPAVSLGHLRRKYGDVATRIGRNLLARLHEERAQRFWVGHSRHVGIPVGLSHAIEPVKTRRPPRRQADQGRRPRYSLGKQRRARQCVRPAAGTPKNSEML
jgi:FxsC-like protein